MLKTVNQPRQEGPSGVKDCKLLACRRDPAVLKTVNHAGRRDPAVLTVLYTLPAGGTQGCIQGYTLPDRRDPGVYTGLYPTQAGGTQGVYRAIYPPGYPGEVHSSLYTLP